MATEDEEREAADGTEVQGEAVDLGTVHLQAHPEGKLSSLMEIKSIGEIIDSIEGTLKTQEDQVLVEAPSDAQLPPEHNLNSEASSLNGHTDKQEKVSNEQPHDNDQEEAELDQSNGINKEDVDGLSHGESTTEDSCILKQKKDEEPKGDDLDVTVDDVLVQEDTLKTDNTIEQTDDGQQDQNQEPEKANENTESARITNNVDVHNSIEQTHDGQQDQNQEPEKANENTEPASITNNANVEIVAEVPTGLQPPVETCMNDFDGIPETIDEKTETYEPTKVDGVVHPEEVAKVEEQQSQQADTTDADVSLEEIKCEETDQQEEKPKFEAHEPTIDAQGVLNQEPAEETDDLMNEKIEETVHQRNMAAPKETTLEHEATMSAPPVNTQVQNQESLEEIEDTEAETQQSSGFVDAIQKDQFNLGVTIDNDTVNEDTLRATEEQDDGQQEEDLEPEKTTEYTQSASMTNIPHAGIVTEAPSGVQTPGESNLDNSDAIPDTIEANTETDEPAKAHTVVYPDQKERFPEDTSTAEPTEEVVKAEDQQRQQAYAMDANIVQEEEPKSEHADEPAADSLEVLNQESAEEIDGPVNTEETDHQETTPEYDTTREPLVDNQAQNQEPLEEREANEEETEVAEAVDTEAPGQQSSVAFEEAVPEDQHNSGVTNNTVLEDTLEATGQTKDGEQYQDLGPDNATENTQPASMANVSDVEVITEAPSGIQTPVEINLDIKDAIPDTTNGNTETDEPAKAHALVDPDKKESFPEDTSTAESTEEVVKLEDQQSQQGDAMDADVVPKSEHTDEPATDALEVLNQESAEEIYSPVNEKTEEMAHQSNMPASEETTQESDTTAREPPVTIQLQNQELLEEREGTEEERQVAEAVDTEVPMQQSSVALEEAVPEDQHYLGVTKNTLQEDTLEATWQTKEVEQYQDLGPENATQNTQPASTANISAEAPSGIQPPVEIDLDISYAIPDTTDGNTETDGPAKTHTVVHPDKKESFPEDTSTTAEPTEEVVKIEDQQSQQADAMDADVVPKSEYTDDPATDALEVLNQESAEETDGPVNKKTEETAHQSNMPVSEETTLESDMTTRKPPVTIQVQDQESLEEREVTEAIDTEAPMQQSSIAFEAVPDDQRCLGVTKNTVEEETLEATRQTNDGEQYQDLGPENATENTQPASTANIPNVEVISKAPSGIQTPVEINLDTSDAIPDNTDGNTETDEPAKARTVVNPDKKESFPEDTCTVEHTEEVIKVEDQLGQQADAIDADVLQEEAPKSEQADEPGVDAQEVLNQESAEKTDGLVNVKTEETEHKSNMVVPEDTMPEHGAQMRETPVNIQEQSQESVGDDEVVNTEAEMQQSKVAFEETTPETHVAAAETCSEIQHVHHVEPEDISGPGDARDAESTNMSNTGNLVQDNILQTGPTIYIQPVQELEQTEMDEASNQTHAVVFNGLTQENAAAISEPQVTEKELKDIEATEAEEITKLDHVNPSKELAIENDSTADEPHNGEIHQTIGHDLVEVKDTKTYHEKTISTSEEDTVEDNVTADEPSCGSQEVDNAESTEETKQNTAENIAEVPEVVIVDEAIERELEQEETNSTEPVESEEASVPRNAALFDYSAQEDSIQESEMQHTESATEIKEIEPTEVEAVPQESNVPEGDPHADIQAAQELGSEEIKKTQIDEVNETSLEMNATVFQTPTQEENSATTELHESTEVSNIEATEVHGNPHQSDAAAPSEEQAIEEIASGLKPESIKDNDTEANEPQSTSQEKIISTSEESVPEEIATEDNMTTEPDVDHQLQDQESAEIKETEADKSQEIVPPKTLSSEESTSEDNVTSTEPSADTQVDNSQLAEENEDKENVKSNTVIAEAEAPETDATVDTSSFHEADLEETKDTGQIETEDVMRSSDYTSEKMDMETMETEAVPHESSVANIKEHTEDDTSTPNASHAGTEPVCELESVEDCTDTTEHPGETHGSTSDDLTPTEENTTVTEPYSNTQEVQNLTSEEIKDSEDEKTDEFSDISSFATPGEADQVPRIEPTPEVQEVQELGLTEETRDIEAVEPEDHQEHIVSTLEKPAVDGEPNADDQQVHEDKLPEVEDNKAIEADEDSKQSNIATPDNAAEERNELETDPDSYAQPAQQMELTKDNENSQLVKAEETSGQSNSVTLEERTTEDSVASEIDPPVDIKQEQKMEEIKGVDTTEAEEDFYTSQSDAIEKLASESNIATIESNIATIEPTYDIQQVDDLEATEEKKNAEAINDGEQSNIDVSEEPTPTDNGATPEDHHVETHEGTIGNETDNVILAHGIKDEIQKSAELKDDACDLGETVLTTQRSENKTDEDAVQTSDNDTLETSNNIHQVKEEPNAGTEDNSSHMSSEHKGENTTHVQDRDVEGQVFTESGTAEASQVSFENDPQAAQDNAAFKAEQTEAAISEILKNEKALHISKETSEGTEEDADAQNDNKDEKDNAENDDIVAKTSTNEPGETTDEIRNEEDPLHIIQASEKETTDEIEESKEIHEDNTICHDELQTNSEKEESTQLLSNEQYNVDAEIDDTTPLCKEIIHESASMKPREIEEIGENKGLDSTSEPYVESSIQNNVEDSSSHHTVEDEKLSMSEKNDVDTEAMQEKNDEFAADTNQTEQSQEEINADDVQQLETEKHSFDKTEEISSHEETETSSTAATEAVTINEDITDKVSGADGAPSNESLKTFTDTGKDLDVSLVIKPSKEENVNDNMENLNLDLPGHLAQDGNTPEKVLSLEETEREMPPSEKLLQTEPGENQILNEQDEKEIQDDNQTPKEKNEEDMQDTEIGEAKKEVEQELPVSHFLMNLILGKESSDTNEDSESEAARKQGEATEDGSCAFISKEKESLGSLPTENKVDDNLTFVELEKHEVKCSEETQEMAKEQSDDLKLDTERSIETDEDIKKNTPDLEIPAYKDNPQDEISGELLPGEAAGVSTEMETRDIDISSVELDVRTVGTVCQENMEASTKNENGSLRSSLNDSTNTNASEEDTLGEGQRGLVIESTPQDKSVDAVSEQAPSLISGITDANDLSSDTASVQSPVSAKQAKPTESSNIEATCSTDIQLENEQVDKKEEEQHANAATDEVSEENVESSYVNLQKITSSEVTSHELETQITESVCDTQKILAHEKETSEENFLTAVEIQADGAKMQINQDKQHEVANNETEMEPEKLGESTVQEHREIGTEQKSPKEIDEGDQQVLLAKKEILTQEQDVHETVQSPQQTVSIKSNEDQELFDSKVQERDLNVVSPTEASGSEENFVDVTKPELSTDEEQSPKADAEEKIYDEMIKNIEGTKNFTDEAAMKTEAPGATQKTRKKQSLLSGVGSKVKHQLAKVKKAIVGKPGRTKPESPKA